MSKYFLLQRQASLEQGFTLIELLVVTIIVGVLAAISVPNLLSQVGKARETEAASNLATVSRSQQGYHFETKQFASTMASLNHSVSNGSGYYNYPDPAISNSAIVKHQATANTPWDLSSRNFSVGVYYNSGVFFSVLCKAVAPTSPVVAPDANTGTCSDSGIRVR